MIDATKIVTGFALKPATWRRIGFTMAQYLQKHKKIQERIIVDEARES